MDNLRRFILVFTCIIFVTLSVCGFLLAKSFSKSAKTENVDLTINSYNETIYVLNDANVSINGGDISSSSSNAVRNNGTGIVEILNGYFLSKNYDCILNYSTGTISIKNGEIVSNLDAAIYNSNANGTLILGEKDGEASVTEPSIIGKTYGVYNKGTFNYYDGIIKGPSSKSIYGNVSEIEDGYSIIKTDNGTYFLH